MEVAGSHRLSLPYQSKCKNVHGHNWIIEVEIQGPDLNMEGMLIDFTHIKEVVNRLDHQNINDIIGPLNPTAEVIARWIADEVQKAINKSWENLRKFKYPDGINYNIPNTRVDEIAIEVPIVTKVSVQESEGNLAIWTKSNTQ